MANVKPGKPWEVVSALPNASMGVGCASLKAELASAERKLATAQRKFDVVATRVLKRIAKVEKAALKAAGKK